MPKLNSRIKKRGRPAKSSRLSINSGRKKASVANASKGTLYNRINELLQNNDLSIIESAAKIGRKRANKAENINSISDDLFQSDNCASEPSVHSHESALAFFLEYDYSVNQYKGLVSDGRIKKSCIYPSYFFVKKEMSKCKPELYSISEIEIHVSLQALLNKSTERLIDSVAKQWNEYDLLNLEFLVTVGFDSSSGHTNPQQSYESENNVSMKAHQSLCVTSMTMIKLRSTVSNECFWVNPTPQSYRFCRPLRLAMENEDHDVILREDERLKQSICSLRAHKFRMENGKSVKVSYHVSQTLYDGKCVNALVGNAASTRCPICLVSSHQFGNLTNKFEAVESNLQYGLGLLHCEIKAFEHLIHIAYRKTLKVWDVREHLKEKYDKQKLIIQKEILEKIGVRVDQVLQGHGTTNTGNVARRCFQDPKLFAEALGMEPKFIKNIAIILAAFKSKKFLKLDKLDELCYETYRLHYTLFPWARMNPSLHKLLKHGCEISKRFPIPIAYYAEDANESWHKIYRKNIKSHARQSSRKNRLLDIFNRAIYLSDPKISLILIENRLKYHKNNPKNIDISKYIDNSLDTGNDDTGEVEYISAYDSSTDEESD